MATPDRESQLVEKIKNLRCVLGFSQERFAEELKVQRPQISRWEKGTEKPSNEKLIVLGNLADDTLYGSEKNVVEEGKRDALQSLAEYPDSHWFWERAGVKLDAVKRSVRRKMAEQNEPVAAKVISISKLDIASLSLLVRGDAEKLKVKIADSISFPSLFISEPKSTFCIQVMDRVGGSPFLAGDIALVQWMQDYRKGKGEKLPILGLPLLLDCLVAVFYENLPLSRELSPDAARQRKPGRLLADRDRFEIELNRQRDPLLRAEEERKDDELFAKCFASATVPGVLFGKLRIQSDENWDRDYNRLVGGLPWRLILDCGATWNGLTDWSTEKLQLDETLAQRVNAGIHVFGFVIGWLRAPGRLLCE